MKVWLYDKTWHCILMKHSYEIFKYISLLKMKLSKNLVKISSVKVFYKLIKKFLLEKYVERGK